MTDEPIHSPVPEGSGIHGRKPSDKSTAGAPPDGMRAVSDAFGHAETPSDAADESIDRATASVGKEER